MKVSRKTVLLAVAGIMLSAGVQGQARMLTLGECRQMAIENNRTLEEARVKTQVADYDRKIAQANYFPKVTLVGAGFHNSDDIALVGPETSAMLTNLGTTTQAQLSAAQQQLMQAITANPQAAMEYMGSPMWQTMLGTLSQTDVSQTLNALGTQIDDALHLDVENVGIGVLTLQQPLFAGGKIVASNRIARLARELAQTQYEGTRSEVLADVEQAYWQIVSLDAKHALAQTNARLLHQIEHDVEIAVREGTATEADALNVRVKANEADMLLLKTENGLALAKMLLCKQIGLPLDTDITLADASEVQLAGLQADGMVETKSMDEIAQDRAELKSLNLATDIYRHKVEVARADMLPTVALTANWLVTNPSVKQGFSNSWGNMWNVGVTVQVPVFHGMEALQHTRKAKAEALACELKYVDACDMVNLQVSQLRLQLDEARRKLQKAGDNCLSADENLRLARVGFEEGVVEANTVLAAQTAALSASSERIDSNIELQMTILRLRNAMGD